MQLDIERFVSGGTISVVEGMSRIDGNGYGILYVVDEDKKLIGSLSDGDIRRWIVKTNDLTAPIEKLMNRDPKYVYCEYSQENVELIKQKYPINSVPVLDRQNHIVDIFLFDDLQNSRRHIAQKNQFDVPVVIMAGGKGTRLYPYTKILPKPLIPIRDTPILERIIEGFHEFGIREFYITVNYRKNMIKSYFSELTLDYNLNFIEEDEPLGTGGSIKLIKKKFNTPIVVANCDQIIQANYKDLYDFHMKSGNAITIVSALKKITIPYGVLKTKENGELICLDEKPTQSCFINTGMYVIDPETIDLIPNGIVFHMTHLVDAVMKSGGKVGMYPVSEDSFLDMGEFSEMKRMEEKLQLSF